jgi:uncharacterized protein
MTVLPEKMSPLAGASGLYCNASHFKRRQRGKRARPSLTLRVGMLSAQLFGIILCGCVSHQQKVEKARDLYWQGDFGAARTGFDEAIKRPKRDIEVLKLDQAMVHFANGEPEAAAVLLREVRDHFDQPDIAGSVQKATSFLTDDTARPYSGEDHEKILLRVMLTLIDLVRQNGDAVAYAHQTGESIDDLLASRPTPADSALDSLEDAPADASPAAKPDIVREELAIAPVMRALVRKSSRMNHDEVLRNFRVATEWRSTSPFLRQELQALEERRDIPRGYGSLYIVMFTGRGPVKKEVTEPVTSQSLLIADRLLSAMGDYELPPTIAPVKIAAMVPSESRVDGLLVSFGDRIVGSMEPIADLNRLAYARHQELLPEIIARAVVRRIVKKTVVVASQSATGAKGDLSSVAWSLAGVLWEASEKADLRSWTLLPGQIQIIRLDIPAGVHQLRLIPTLNGHMTGVRPIECNVDVIDGEISFALGMVPESDQPGRVFTTSSWRSGFRAAPQ